LAAGTDCLREQAQLARSPTAELTWQAFLQRLQDAMSPEAHATAWQQAWGSGTSELMRLAQGLRADGGGAIQA